jgi:hypothetical protein
MNSITHLLEGSATADIGDRSINLSISWFWGIAQ